MRCPGWTPGQLPADLRQRMMLIRVPDSDARRLRACMASLVQAAQARSLLERVAHRHTFFLLSQINLSNIDTTNMGQERDRVTGGVRKLLKPDLLSRQSSCMLLMLCGLLLHAGPTVMQPKAVSAWSAAPDELAAPATVQPPYYP